MQKSMIVLIVVCLVIMAGVIFAMYKTSAPSPDYKIEKIDTNTVNTQNNDEIKTEETPISNSGSNTVILHTAKGDIAIELLPELAPNHVANFKKLAESGFYDGTRFHRVIAGFMIQGGDPLTKDESKRAMWGTGGPGYTIPAEFNNQTHSRGIVSMARSNDPNSAGSQFFIVVKDSPFLDKQYTVFGRVIKGMDIADSIVASNGGKELPDNPIVLSSVEVK